MRKKELLLTLKKYIEKNAELESRISDLIRANEEILSRSEELLQRAENAERALELFDRSTSVNQVDDQPSEQYLEDSYIAEDISFQDEETVESDEKVNTLEDISTEKMISSEETEKTPDTICEPLETEDGIIDVSALESISVNREMQYAGEAIGDIVVKCAILCNEFAKHGGPTCRELINLALGRTEVFKADCLTIASSNTTFSVKKECVDRIKAEAEDYFDSLRAQLD